MEIDIFFLNRVLTKTTEHDIIYLTVKEKLKRRYDMDMSCELIEEKVMDNIRRLYNEALNCPTKKLVGEKWAIAYATILFAVNELFPYYNFVLYEWYSTNYHQRFVELAASRE